MDVLTYVTIVVVITILITRVHVIAEALAISMAAHFHRYIVTVTTGCLHLLYKISVRILSRSAWNMPTSTVCLNTICVQLVDITIGFIVTCTSCAGISIPR